MWKTHFIILNKKLIRPQAVWKKLWKIRAPVEKTAIKFLSRFSTGAIFQQPVEMWKTLFKY